MDLSKRVYVVEGPFDSTFIKNSIAMCGSYINIELFSCNLVYTLDNESRNKQILNIMETVINVGNQLVIWPKYIVEKDINDMVLSGLDPQKIMDSSIYSGLEARIKFLEWRKA